MGISSCDSSVVPVSVRNTQSAAGKMDESSGHQKQVFGCRRLVPDRPVCGEDTASGLALLWHRCSTGVKMAVLT